MTDVPEQLKYSGQHIDAIRALLHAAEHSTVCTPSTSREDCAVQRALYAAIPSLYVAMRSLQFERRQLLALQHVTP